MKTDELAQISGFEIISQTAESLEIKSGYTSDLLSDIMANAPEGSILITIQAHKNTVAVATLTGSPAILICNNREIPQDMKDAADNKSIVLFKTDQNQYESSFQIHKLLDAAGTNDL